MCISHGANYLQLRFMEQGYELNFEYVYRLYNKLIEILLIAKRDRAGAVEYESVGIWMLVLEMLFFCIGYDVASAMRMAELFGSYLIISIPNLIDRGITSENMKLNAIVLVVILTGAQYIA